MNRRSLIFVVSIVLFVCGVLLLEKSRNQSPVVEVKTTPAPVAAPALEIQLNLENRLGWEEQRLTQLRSDLQIVEQRQSSAELAATQLNTLNTEFQDMTAELRRVQNESLQVAEAELDFNFQQQQENIARQVDTENQIQEINTDISNINNEISNGSIVTTAQTEISQLQIEKEQLLSQRRAANLEAQAAVAQNAQETRYIQSEVLTEIQNLERQRNDLAVNMQYWKKWNPTAVQIQQRQDRIQALKEQIALQERRTAALRQNLSGL